MEDVFDVGAILSEEEAEKFFEQQEAEEREKKEETHENDNPAEKEEEEETPPKLSEKVGEEEKTEEDAAPDGDGSSPNVYSSIAKALKVDGIFSDISDEDLQKIDSPEALSELFDRLIESRMDERQKRIDQALSDGVAPDKVREYEKTIAYLGGITEEALTAEGEEGDKLRRMLIFNDLINRGYTEDKARKELEKSFKAGSDVDDARDALEALNKYYQDGYDKIRNDAKKQNDSFKAEQKKRAEDLRKMIVDTETKIGDVVIDKRTRQRMYDVISKPVYKDPETGTMYTELQKFQKENPLEFIKQLSMWYVLTDAGKNLDGFTKEQLRKEKNKGIQELARKINSTGLNDDGTLRYPSRRGEDSDPLLAGGWEVDMGTH